MKQYILLGGILALSNSVFAAPCTNGTLADYIALGAGGCQNGSVLFSAFATAPGQTGATLIAPTLITVTPDGTLFLPNLLFTVNRTASSNQLLESFFRFKATSTSVLGAAVALNGSATGTGDATASLDICRGAMFVGNSPTGCANTSTVLALQSVGFSLPSDSTTFPPVSLVDVFADLVAEGGGNGTGTLNSATITLTATPEPSTSQLFLAGISLLAMSQRRRFSLLNWSNKCIK